MMNDYRFIPSMDELLNTLDTHKVKRKHAKRILNGILDEIKRQLPERGLFGSRQDALGHIRVSYEKCIEDIKERSFRRVLNCTGIILHTNLGRAPYSDIIDHILPMLKSYINLEMDIRSNTRTDRLESLKEKIRLMSGFEDCLFVNNNAAAFLLICNTLSKGREIIVSRGELVEIGGSFRIPDIIGVSQARLIEAGTTNITRIEDYESKIGDTGLIAKIHKSNYSINGHTEDVSTAALLELSRRHGVILYEDMGSHDISDLDHISSDESYIASFSMDKIAGAVQSGIILSTQNIISKLKRNPLYRTLRLSKFPLLYLDCYLERCIFGEENAKSDSLARKTKESLQERISHVFNRISNNNDIKMEIMPSIAEYGGGSGTENIFDSYCIAISGDINRLDSILRTNVSPPVISRIGEKAILLDIAAIPPEEDELLISVLNQAFRLYEK